MKKAKLSVFSIIGIMTISSFTLADNSNYAETSDLAMTNIEDLHASVGGEMKCDQNNAEYTIVVPADKDIIIGTNTGYLLYNW